MGQWDVEFIEIRTILVDVVKYPAGDWMKVILLGFISLISMIGVLTELNIFTGLCLLLLPLPFGYLLKIVDTTFNGHNDLPDFHDWKSMYLNGLKVILTILIYSIPLLAIFILFNYYNLLTLEFPNFSIINLGALLLSSTIPIIIFIAIGLIEYIGIANMALYEGQISAAFRFREIIERISMIGWKKYLLFYLIIWMVAIIFAIISFLTVLVIIGMLLTPLLIVPYFLMLNARFLALVFASSES